MHSNGVRQKPLTTLLGKVTLRRAPFKDATGTCTRIPLDESPSVTGTSFSPATVLILYVSFDGTGVPMRKSELHSSKGKGPDGKARTREVKLGCIFIQIATDEAGWPVRDPYSTTYVGAIESSELFGLRIYQEAVRRGSEQAHKIVVLIDGARYNKSIASTHFPEAVNIIGLYHAREHLSGLAKTLGIDDAQLLVRPSGHGSSREHPRSSKRPYRCPFARQRSRRYTAQRLRSLPRKRPFDGLRRIPHRRIFCRLRLCRGRLPHSHRRAPQAIGHVLELARSQRHPRFSLLSDLRALRGLLGSRRLKPPFLSCTQCNLKNVLFFKTFIK